ncbi:MAG TPA: cytochrome c oxidase subunit 4 [Acidimicrobiales bacterium]|nr:cytochrome c oxidase subunit 4 [Acidimicrobiales bacterium]
MFNLATKLLFALAGLTLVGAVVYAVADDDWSGIVLLLFVAATAVVLALVLRAAGGSGPTRDETDAVPAPPPMGASGASLWPVLVALSVGIVAVGAAVGSGLLAVATVVFVLCLLGWLAQSLAEHRLWDNSQAQRLADRLLVPVGLPIGVVLLVGVIVISLSRVLLALPKTGSTVLALAAAVVILAACTLVAARPQLGSGALIGLAMFAAVSTIAGGIAGAVAGEREFSHHAEGGGERPAEHDPQEPDRDDAGQSTESPAAHPATTVVGDQATGKRLAPSGPVEIAAKAIEFDKTSMTLPASGGEIEFHNDDAAIPHNVSLYPAATGNTGPPAFKGDVFNGPSIKTYELGTLEPGDYLFQCDIHPTMKGKAVVA